MRKRFERFFSCPGERIKQNYTASRLGDGVIRLVPSNTVDLKEYINSFAESCSIEHILALCAAGDTSVLSRAQGAYMDTTQMPKTFRDVLDIVIDGRTKFDSLPAEIKQKFDNDFEQWFSDAGSENWLKSMGFLNDTESEPIKNEGSDLNAES